MGYKLFLEWTASVMMLRQLRQRGSITTVIYRQETDFADISLVYSSAKKFLEVLQLNRSLCGLYSESENMDSLGNHRPVGQVVEHLKMEWNLLKCLSHLGDNLCYFLLYLLVSVQAVGGMLFQLNTQVQLDIPP